MVELDVRLSADGVAVVSHDASLARRTGTEGFVHESTVAELKRLDASGGEGVARAPVEIPTLREVLEALSGRIAIDIEVKNLPEDPDFDSPTEAVAEQVVRLIEELDLAATVLVSSFNWLSIERVRERAPGIATGFLTSPAIDPTAALVYTRRTGHGFVLPHAYALEDAGPAFVEAAHADGIRVGTWTVDEPDRIARLFEWGVDLLVTNDPATGVAVRDRFVRDRG